MSLSFLSLNFFLTAFLSTLSKPSPSSDLSLDASSPTVQGYSLPAKTNDFLPSFFACLASAMNCFLSSATAFLSSSSSNESATSGLSCKG